MSKRHIKNTKTLDLQITMDKKTEENKTNNKIGSMHVADSIKIIGNSNNESILLFSIGCDKISYGTLYTRIIVTNENETIVKSEDYNIIFLCNKNHNTSSVKISQINSTTTDYDETKDITFIQNYTTKITSTIQNKIDGSNIISIFYNYKWNNWCKNCKINVNYDINYHGTCNIEINSMD